VAVVLRGLPVGAAVISVADRELSASRRWLVLAVCASSLFLVGLDTTIVNIALPAVGEGLSIGTRGLEWVVDAYVIVFASLLITSGALADRFGRRRVFMVGLIVSVSPQCCARWLLLAAR
jgi:MFS family permease